MTPIIFHDFLSLYLLSFTLLSELIPTRYLSTIIKMSSSEALVKRSAESALMPPPPAPKRIKRPTKVLDEDTYTDALSHIITRDFFPGLLELETQEDYLNALESNDSDWIASAGQRLSEAMTPGPDGRRLRGRRGVSMTPTPGLFGLAGATPRNLTGAETPGTVLSTTSKSTAVASTQTPQADTNMSLNTFQAKYTSEDAESFNKLLDRQNIKKVEKNAWLWSSNKIPEPRQIAYRKQQEKLLTDSQEQEATDGKLRRSISAPDLRPAGPDSWRSNPRNALMFRPDGIEDTMQSVQQKVEETSRAAPKAVVYDNTRLPLQLSSSADDSPIPPSPSLSAVKDAIAGRPRLAPSEGGYTGAETPRVNGYAFVDSEEPEPEPEAASEQHASAWSRISFDGVDKTPNPFEIQARSSREDLHHRMVEKVARSKRREKLQPETAVGRTPVPRFGFTPRVAGVGIGGIGGLGTGTGTSGSATPSKNLTPAGHRLLDRLGGVTPAWPGLGSGSGGRGVWEGESGKTPKGGLLKGVVTPRKKG